MRCEKCGSAATTEIVFSTTGTTGALAVVPKVQRRKIFPKYSYMTGWACTDCGAVFGLKLNEPEKFKPFVDYSGK